MHKSYSLTLIVILIWLLQNAFSAVSLGGCCQKSGVVCNCSNEFNASCNKISEGYCDVTCIEEVPITTSSDKSNTNITFRNVHVVTVGIIPSFNSSLLVTSNNCPEYMDFVVQPYLYSGQSHYRSPPII